MSIAQSMRVDQSIGYKGLPEAGKALHILYILYIVIRLGLSIPTLSMVVFKYTEVIIFYVLGLLL